jgi:hypothetical protein
LDLCRAALLRDAGGLGRPFCGWFRRVRHEAAHSKIALAIIAPGVGADALLAVASSLFKQRDGFALLAALLTGVFLGGEN